MWKRTRTYARLFLRRITSYNVCYTKLLREVVIDAEKIFMRFVDEGPGIADIEQAMTEGFSTASEEVRHMGFGAGMGLPNIKRNADDLQVESIVGKGSYNFV